MGTKNNDKLCRAAKRTAEIVLEQMATLLPDRAKAMREEIRKLAAKKSGSKTAALQKAK